MRVNNNDVMKSNGNVLLVDPNLVNVPMLGKNEAITNGIPQYQDMYIFAELTARRKKRTVLIKDSHADKYSTDNGDEQFTSVNFIGNNQNQDSPNHLKFTTNYYDGSTHGDTQYEGFGIGSINVKINSSYIPQVNIQFIDSRGLTFFNQANSPYKMIFDFPPPIFNLRLKGYYGRALEYQLHLVKYTTEFKAENGNYVIDAQFIAITYAPLTDVLFRYVVNFPLINNIISINSDVNKEPRNTYELILKLKSLYSQSSQMLKTDIDSQVYNSTLNSINDVVETIDYLSSYKNNSTLTTGGIPLLFVRNKAYSSEGGNELTLLTNVAEYDSYIKSKPTDGLSNSLSQRLCIGFLVNENINANADETPPVVDSTGAQIQEILANYTVPTADFEKYLLKEPDVFAYYIKDKVLKKYNSELISTAKNKGVNDMLNTDVPAASFLKSDENVAKSTKGVTNRYAMVDVTDYYVRLYKLRDNLQKTKNESMGVVNEKINNMVIENLGMKPTVYNIFKIILNDVDVFFRELLTTSKDAEKHHNENDNKKKISNGKLKDSGDNGTDKIYSFPLMIKQQDVCNQKSEVRAAPIEFNSICKFPEIELIEKFIKTFTDQLKLTEQFNAKSAQNEDGSFKWIPISPLDSILAIGGLQPPYYGIDSSSKINLSDEKRLVQVFKNFLPRFYVLSQNSLADGFYDNKKSDLITMYAKAEAINLVTTLINPEYVDSLSVVSNAYKNNIELFYNYLKSDVSEYYNFENKESFRLASNGIDIYIDRGDDRYIGYNSYDGDIVLQSPENTSDTLIAKFQKTTSSGIWNTYLRYLGAVNVEYYYNFTQENVFYIKDASPKADTVMDSIDIQSRYIGNLKMFELNKISGNVEFKSQDYFLSSPTAIVLGVPLWLKNGFPSDSIPKETMIDGIVGDYEINGNAFFPSIGATSNSNAKKLEAFGNFLKVWSNQLAYNDKLLYDTIIDYESDKYDSKLSALILLSNFGYSLSPFNMYPFSLNDKIFNIPAAVEVPYYLGAYIGSVVDIDVNSDEYKKIYDFFVNGAGKKLNTSGAFIFADIIDVNKYLSSADKAQFKEEFNRYYNSGKNYGTHYLIVTALRNLYKLINGDDGNKVVTLNNKEDLYYKELSSDGDYFNDITERLMKRVTLLNYNQITFNRKKIDKEYYDSLSKNETNKDKKTVNDMFFKEFFTEISKNITEKKSTLIAEEQENKKTIGDEDIITQTYYSFKNINDKWLTSPRNDSGYPQIENGSRLIDSFVFVDRAMKPIGDTIINPEMLIEMLDDPNLSVFSVLTQLLSVNGFEFFPLQNFMSFEHGEWEDSFRINTGKITTQTPTFVCMYIGGGSSYPTGIGLQGQFKDDGIVDISAPGTSDFDTFNKGEQGCYPVPTDDNQMETNKKFKFGEVRAFRVRFGEQNQSMFSDIKIDSKEYPETNESIQILSRIAGDNKLQAPAPKGQNLYNLYENRSYKATVTGLGNVMIQPTQYFQLENVPLFNGAYIILGVEHNIIPNKMTTSFYGTKILKYPVPRVLNSSSIVGYEGGSSDNTNISLSTAEEVTMGVGTASNPAQAQFNSMYTFKI